MAVERMAKICLIGPRSELDETLEVAWRLLEGFPREELKRIKQRTLDARRDAAESQAGDPAAAQPAGAEG